MSTIRNLAIEIGLSNEDYAREITTEFLTMAIASTNKKGTFKIDSITGSDDDEYYLLIKKLKGSKK